MRMNRSWYKETLDRLTAADDQKLIGCFRYLCDLHSEDEAMNLQPLRDKIAAFIGEPGWDQPKGTKQDHAPATQRLIRKLITEYDLPMVTGNFGAYLSLEPAKIHECADKLTSRATKEMERASNLRRIARTMEPDDQIGLKF